MVTAQLRRWLAGEDDLATVASIWERWIEIWSQFPLDGFLQSTLDAILTKIPDESTGGLECLQELVPWPQAAITAYSVFSYTEQLDQCLVQYLRDQLGEWGSSSMHTIEGGMSKLPKAFTKPNKHGWNKTVHIYNNINFKHTVNEVVYTSHEDDPQNTNHVTVKGYYSVTGRPFEIDGDAVIVTTPTNIIRQIKFTNADDSTIPPPLEFYKAIEDIWSGPSTKIMIQSKTRFWEAEGIQGGFSKTNLPIGQIHYPSNPDGNSIPGDKGILLIYTWKAEALLFGSLDPLVALYEAVRHR